MSLKRNEFLQHDIYRNFVSNKQTTVPRHPKLDKFLCDAIYKQLEIPKP
jgi:hypothetical protein